MSRAAVAPSPEAEATCLVEPARTSPAAKTPGRLVAKISGGSWPAGQVGWWVRGWPPEAPSSMTITLKPSRALYNVLPQFPRPNLHSEEIPVMPKATWNGAVLAQSDYTEVMDGYHYFPPDSLNRDYLRESRTQ